MIDVHESKDDRVMKQTYILEKYSVKRESLEIR